MVVAWYPGHGAGPSPGEQQTSHPETLPVEDMLCFVGDAISAHPCGGVAGKGQGRKSELVMNYVWKQPKHNVFKPFHCSHHVYWKSQPNPLSCTVQTGRKHQMSPETKEMKLCPQGMSIRGDTRRRLTSPPPPP